MKSKVLIILIFCLVGSNLVSCIFWESCNPVPPYFEIQNLNSNNMRFTNSGLNPWEAIEENKSINWSNFFTRFGFELNYISSYRALGSELMALSCDPPGYAGDKSGVDTIIVRTVFDYNESFKAGSVINDIIVTNDWTYRIDDFDNFTPLDHYLSMNSEGVRLDYFELKLSEAPSGTTKFSFDVTYILNNGEEFRHQTAPVNLIN